MAKDPALLWYPSDWVTGTQGMTLEEKGAYMELLMLQFNRGHMTSHMVGQVIGQVWDKVRIKFRQDEEGLWYNERLDAEKEKRKAFTNSRKNNISGKNQYSKKGHMTSHMVNGNINVNTSINGKKIDEKFETVFFEDGSSQELGSQQAELLKNGHLKVREIKKGVSY